MKKVIHSLVTSNFFKKPLVRLLNLNLFCNSIISLLLIVCRLLAKRKGFVHKVKRWHIAKKEVKFITMKLNDHSLVLLNYDLKYAPPSYGELLFFLMLCRYFFHKNIKANVFISNASEHTKLIDDFLPFFSKIVSESNISILPGDLAKTPSNAIEVFARSRGLNKVAHHHNFNLLNLLMAREPNDFCQNFLFKHSDFGTDYDISGPYVAVHCRYTTKQSKLYHVEKMRNTSETQFVKLVKSISKLFPEKKIIILSDTVGTDFYKSISSKHGLNCFFSESKEKSFFSDAKIVLEAEWYFQLNGGGLSAVAWFSQINYVTFVKAVANEVQWDFNRLTSWATKQQVFRQISLNEEFFSYLKVCKLTTDKNVSKH